MKQTVELQKAQGQMAPGVITRDGFLGTDSRPLVDILVADDAEVKRLGLTHELIARRMSELRDAGARGLGEYIEVEGGFEVRVESVRGKLPCPFGDVGLFPKTSISVRSSGHERELVYSDLLIHLIHAHGFYEGKGNPFRLEPREIAEVLDVKGGGGG